MATVSDYLDANPNFTQDGLDRVLEQFKRSPNYNAFIQTSSERFNGLQLEAVKLAKGRLLENAEGDVLDAIGNQLRVPRQGNQTDSEYKNTIRLNSVINQGSGTRDEVAEGLLRNSGDEEIIIFKGTKHHVSISVFLQCQGTLTGAKTIASIMPIGTNLRVTSRGGGYTFAFVGYPRVDGLRGFGSVGSAVEILDTTTPDASDWVLTGGGNIAGGILTLTGVSSATSNQTIQTGEYTAQITASGITGIVTLEGEQLKDGLNNIPVTISGGDGTLNFLAEAGSTASISDISLKSYERPLITPVEKGRLSGLVYNTETIN